MNAPYSRFPDRTTGYSSHLYVIACTVPERWYPTNSKGVNELPSLHYKKAARAKWFPRQSSIQIATPPHGLQHLEFVPRWTGDYSPFLPCKAVSCFVVCDSPYQPTWPSPKKYSPPEPKLSYILPFGPLCKSYPRWRYDCKNQRTGYIQ
ncbi:hypothetical protein SDC9_114471 [bioreactor metagenome]|uniref:Uncharacterized protein n=1 Tax=bioreactor metagenome TaxID=1076179 RepID=A0A645BR12_9ZZZZ